MTEIGRELEGFWIALQFLTRFPVMPRAGRGTEELGTGLPWFPIVGLLLGACLVGLDVLGQQLFSPLVTSVVLVGFLAALTGALHLDGLGDTADAVFSHASPQRRLDIMKDPRSGTFGVVAIAVILALKISAISSLPSATRVLALLAAPALARWAILVAAFIFPYGRTSGLGSPVKGAATLPLVLVTGCFCLLTAALQPLVAVSFLLLALATAVGVGAWLSSRLPGLTGDCYGAICEIVETLVFVSAAPLARLVT